MAELTDRDQMAAIYGALSDEAKALITAVLSLEQEQLHLPTPSGVPDQIVRRVEAIVK